MLIDPRQSALLVVDIQERLAPATFDPGRVVAGAGLLMQAAARLDLPVLVSEQYPKGLGPTVEPLRALAPAGAVVEKLHFSCADEPAVMARLDGLGRSQAVIVGMEAHICVLQTALGLAARGWRPVVVADATASRTEASHQAAMARLAAAGVVVATVEMVLFEWLQRAGTPEFKELSRLVK